MPRLEGLKFLRGYQMGTHKILWIHGIIQNSYYGINLEAIGVSRGTEAEVVFPTIKECIKEVKVYE